MNNRRIALIGIVVSLLTLVLVMVALADPLCPTEFQSCALTDGFDTTASSWQVDSPAVGEWLERKDWFDVSFGSVPDFGSHGGVLRVAGAPKRVYKSVLLSPGEYVLRVRMSSDADYATSGATQNAWFTITGSNGYETFIRRWLNTDGGADRLDIGSIYGTLDSDRFTITETQLVRVSIYYQVHSLFFGDADYTLFVDEVILGRTNTPIGGGATYTPQPTAIPQSTAQPSSGTFCIAPPRFDEFNSIPVDDHWGILVDDGKVFTQSIGISRTTSAVLQVSNINYPGSMPGAVALPYATGSLPTRPAWVYSRTTFSNPSFIIVEAKADSVPLGVTATLSFYGRDASGAWSLISSKQENSITWTQSVVTFTLPITDFTGIGLSASRSDSPSSGYVYVDRIYIYGHELLAPRCDGTYPDGIGNPRNGGVSIIVPFDKPCPQPITSPNNFFGFILTYVTLFLDWATAPFPIHTRLGVRDTLVSLINAPIWIFADMAGRLFDLRPVITAVIAILSLEVVRWLWLAWLYIKRTVPFLGG